MAPEPTRNDESNPQAFFGDISGKYVKETFSDDRTSSTLGRMGRTGQVLRLLDKHLPGSGVTIADIGCGPGQFARPLADRGHTYIGMDINESMFADSASEFEDDARISFKVGDVESIPLEDGSVDSVICIGVVEYIPGDAAALKQIARVLKPSGFAIVTFPNIRYPLNLLRVVLRPVLAPVLRACVPRWRDRVYVSGIRHRTLNPTRFIAAARECGLEVVEELSDGFLSLFNHRVGRCERWLSEWCAKWGQRLFPRCGSNYYVCLRKP